MSGAPLSRERLNQIAGRKLSSLGVACAVGADGRLVGDILTGDALLSPFNGAPVGAAHFVVEAHDHLRFLSPPLLAGLPPLPFFDHDNVAGIVSGIAQSLQRRLEAVARLKTHLHHLRVNADVDREHGVLVAPVQVAGAGTVVLIGDEQGLRSSHLRPLGGGQNLPMPPLSIDLSQFADATDLALFVGDLASRAKPAAHAAPKTGIFRPPPEFFAGAPQGASGQTPPAGIGDAGFGAMPSTGDFTPDGSVQSASAAAAPVGSSAAGTDEFLPPSQAFQVPQDVVGGARGQPAQGDIPAGSVTAGMLARCLGESAQIAHGIAVQRRFFVNGRGLKLTLKQKRGRVFVGRLAFEDYILWQGEIEVDKHPPMDIFVRELLRGQGLTLDEVQPAGSAAAPPAAASSSAPPPSPPAPVAPAARQPAFGSSAGEQLPIAGEIWVMNVVVEQQDEREVRYSAINAEGQPYGAPRILPKSEFDKVFAQHKGGFRLLVRVVGAAPQQVVYVQLDPSYQPNSETRAIAPSIFLANFLPEAADY